MTKINMHKIQINRQIQAGGELTEFFMGHHTMLVAPYAAC